MHFAQAPPKNALAEMAVGARQGPGSLRRPQENGVSASSAVCQPARHSQHLKTGSAGRQIRCRVKALVWQLGGRHKQDGLLLLRALGPSCGTCERPEHFFLCLSRPQPVTVSGQSFASCSLLWRVKCRSSPRWTRSALTLQPGEFPSARTEQRAVALSRGARVCLSGYVSGRRLPRSLVVPDSPIHVGYDICAWAVWKDRQEKSGLGGVARL